MTIDELVYSQALSQAERFGKEVRHFTLDERIEFIRTQVLGGLDELHEVLAETGWKPWKKNGYGNVNREKFIKELTDVLIFWTNLAIAVDATPQELSAAIRATQTKNADRVAAGY